MKKYHYAHIVDLLCETVQEKATVDTITHTHAESGIFNILAKKGELSLFNHTVKDTI